MEENVEEKKDGSVAVIIVVIIAFLLFIFLITRNNPTETTELQKFAIFATPTVDPNTPMPTPSATPVATDAGDTWMFVSMEEKVIYQNGYWYDVGTFQNIQRPDILIKAMCMAPLWPSPTPGVIYQLNDYEILYPVVDNESNNLQRFLLLK